VAVSGVEEVNVVWAVKFVPIFLVLTLFISCILLVSLLSLWWMF